MADVGKLRKQRSRGEQAKRLLENPLIKEAFEAIEQAITDGWKNSAADDDRARQNAYLLARLLENFKQQFRTVINTGKVAEKDLLEIAEKPKS